MLSFNGARIVDCASGDIIYQRTIPASMVAKLYYYAKEQNCGIITYLGDTVLSGFEPDEYIILEAGINGLPIQLVEDFPHFIDFEVNKCLMTAPPEKAERIEKDLQEKYGDRLSVYRSEPFFIEIMPKDVNKATSLSRVLPVVGATKEDAICCGDGYNDISMIEYAGLGVAMGNAQEAVKQAADYITKTNDEDGLVQVIDEFMK